MFKTLAPQPSCGSPPLGGRPPLSLFLLSAVPAFPCSSPKGEEFIESEAVNSGRRQVGESQSKLILNRKHWTFPSVFSTSNRSEHVMHQNVVGKRRLNYLTSFIILKCTVNFWEGTLLYFCTSRSLRNCMFSLHVWTSIRGRTFRPEEKEMSINRPVNFVRI